MSRNKLHEKKGIDNKKSGGLESALKFRSLKLKEKDSAKTAEIFETSHYR